MRLKRMQNVSGLSSSLAMLETKGVRRTTGVSNIEAGNFGGYIIFLFIVDHLISSLSCDKINFTGVLWEDDHYA